MTEWSTPHLKVILIGNSGVGKSSFMTRFVHHRFTNLYRATIGVDFLTKDLTIDKRSVILQDPLIVTQVTPNRALQTVSCNNTQLFLQQIWDTAGTERFHSLGTTLYRGAHCCLLVFDVTSSVSFDALDVWKTEFLVQACPSDPSTFPFIVLGNKVDLDYREVSPSKAQQWCREIGAEYLECSGKEDIGVDMTFHNAARAALQYLTSHHVENREDIQITQKQQKPNKKCYC